jgi:hypothetical protein
MQEKNGAPVRVYRTALQRQPPVMIVFVVLPLVVAMMCEVFSCSEPVDLLAFAYYIDV